MLKLLLGAALISGQAAPAPQPERCITREEVGNLSVVGASVAVELVRSACRSYLPATAFLATPAGAEFSARLHAEGQRRLDSAIDGIARLSGDGSAMPRTAIRAMIQGMMSQGAGADLARQADASLCRDTNEIMEIAATLSPDQMARFVGAFASIADHVARMRPPPAPAHPAPPEATPPTPHPAALEIAPTRAPPPVVVVPIERVPGARTPPRPPIRPFLCPQPQ